MFPGLFQSTKKQRHFFYLVENMRVKNFLDLMVFTLAVRENSLTAAGQELGLSLAVVSKRMKSLEEQLGVRLLNRSTRRISVTEAGAEFYQYCVRVLAEMEEGEDRITRGNQEPRGTLKISVPAAFGRLHVAPLIPGFLSRYPQIRISLHLADAFVDIINDGYDLAVRIGDLEDSSLIAKPLGRDRRVVVATPTYIRKHGAPKAPCDLVRHNALIFSGTVCLDQWEFVDAAGKRETVKVSGNLETNNCDALREALFADLGIALRPLWDIWKDLQNGDLVHLLPAYIVPAFTIHAVYPCREYLPRKTRVFVEFLREHFGDTPYWDDVEL